MSFPNIDLICGKCGITTHKTMNIKPIRDMLRSSNGRCKDCGTILNHNDFSIAIIKK